MNKPILITGSSGFIGSRLAQTMMQRGFVVHGCDDFSFGDKHNTPEGLHFFNQRFQELTQEQLSEYGVLIHLATSNIIYSMTNPIETMINNGMDTIAMFRRFKGKIINMSTSSVYGQADILPTPETAKIRTDNAYSVSKRIVELFLMERGNYTTLRLSNVYGPGQRASNPYCGVLGKFLKNSISSQTSQIYGIGDQTRDYTYIDDVVEAIIKVVKAPALETEFNIGTGIETSIIELIGLIPNKGEWIRVPERVIDNIKRRCLDISKAKARLDWSPKVKIKDGIIKTLEYLKGEAIRGQ